MQASQMAISTSEEIDVAIIGNGPSALILSYILSGHRPYYTGRHHDPLLHNRLSAHPDLLHIEHGLYDHLRDDIKYSSQALPINVLLDTLLRPGGDVGLGAETCVEWKYEPSKALRHVVLGDAPHPGGQWASNALREDCDVGTLSYAEQLSLPGYSFAEHWRTTRGHDMPDFLRPRRADVAHYLECYPAAVGITNNIRCSFPVTNITRTSRGFRLGVSGCHCRRLVLASGISSAYIPPPQMLKPMLRSSDSRDEHGPILVIGSGFTAADLIISAPPGRKLLHFFKWDVKSHANPLKGCHGSAYPEYAWIYRRMKAAAASNSRTPDGTKGGGGVKRSRSRKQPGRPPVSATSSFNDRDWNSNYEGFADVTILSVTKGVQNLGDRDACDNGLSLEDSQNFFTVTFVDATGRRSTRAVASLRYAVGRRGSLSYLSNPLETEVMEPWSNHSGNVPPSSPSSKAVKRTSSDGSNDHIPSSPPSPQSSSLYPGSMISSSTLHSKIESQAHRPAAGLELAKSVFAIGSLAGDSLVRFTYGGCCAVAGALEDSRSPPAQTEVDHLQTGETPANPIVSAVASPQNFHAPATMDHCNFEDRRLDKSVLDEWRAVEENWWIWAG